MNSGAQLKGSLHKFKKRQRVWLKPFSCYGTIKQLHRGDDGDPFYDVLVRGEVIECFEREIITKKPNKFKQLQGTTGSTLGDSPVSPKTGGRRTLNIRGRYLGKTEDGWNRYEVNQLALAPSRYYRSQLKEAEQAEQVFGWYANDKKWWIPIVTPELALRHGIQTNLQTLPRETVANTLSYQQTPGTSTIRGGRLRSETSVGLEDCDGDGGLE